jgi:hypothetical protein
MYAVEKRRSSKDWRKGSASRMKAPLEKNMSERQTLVEEAMKLIQETGIQPIFNSASSSLARRSPQQLDGSPTQPTAEPAKKENPSTYRHDRKCSICRHRDRADIEQEFLHWRSPEKIAKEYGITHYSSIYRHARATGLFAQRATNLRIALSPIIEQSMEVSATADNVIRAVIAFAHLNDLGEWVEPPKIFIHHRADDRPPSGLELNVALGASARHPDAPTDESEPSTNDAANPNRKLQLLEYDSTR